MFDSHNVEVLKLVGLYTITSIIIPGLYQFCRGTLGSPYDPLLLHEGMIKYLAEPEGGS